jgi:uncharacterized protein YegL
MSLTSANENPRRTMVLFLVIDTSGSMDGEKIGALNVAIEETIPEIREVSDKNPDAQIKIAVLEFSSGVKWLTPNGPVEPDQFRWNYLHAVGVTDLGAAFMALNEKLSTKAFMQEAAGSFAPAIFLLTDGEPTDDWQNGLAMLKQNRWFQAGIKAAIAIGNDANKNVLKEFTGSMESVVEVHNKTMLKEMIKFVAVTSSKVGSKSTNAGATSDADKQRALEKAIEEGIETAAVPDNDDGGW